MLSRNRFLTITATFRQRISQDRHFKNLFEIWLAGDHYKWRAMRAHGVDERFCTGNASPYEKFLAWAGAAPQALRNPLFHWTQLELKRYFGMTDLLGPHTAKSTWETANALLATKELSAQGSGSSIKRKP
jgi:glucuronate isomerase